MGKKEDTGVKIEKPLDIEYGLDFNFSVVKHENGDLESGVKITDSEGLDFSTEICTDDVKALSDALMEEVSQQLYSHCMKLAAKKQKTAQAELDKKKAERDNLRQRLDELDKERAKIEKDLAGLKITGENAGVRFDRGALLKSSPKSLYDLFYY